jgi:hypothetical protein
MSFGVIEALRASRPRETLELVHRLDRDTSGCLLVARDRRPGRAARLDPQWRHAQDLSGAGRAAGSSAPSASMRRSRPTTASTANGMCAWPRPARIRSACSSRCSSSAAGDLDGSGHSDRAHASDPRACLLRGHPLLGDDKYGDRERNAELKRTGLKRTSCTRSRWPSIGRDPACRFTSARRCRGTRRGARCHHAHEAPARKRRARASGASRAEERRAAGNREADGAQRRAQANQAAAR